MLGVLKAGGVYVPLDPQAPADRIGYIIGNCGIRVLLTRDETSGKDSMQPRSQSLIVCVLIDEALKSRNGGRVIPWTLLAEYPAAHAPQVTLTETDLAYILYTSGSTGRPKGVMLTPSKRADLCRVVRGQIPDHERRSAFQSCAPALRSFRVRRLQRARSGCGLYMITEDLALFPATAGRVSSRRSGSRSGTRCLRR